MLSPIPTPFESSSRALPATGVTPMRERLAAALFGAGVFMPLGLANLPPAWPDSYKTFIVLLLAATVLVPGTFRQVWRAVPAWRSVTAVMLIMIAWVVLPIGLSDGPWRLVDYPSRLLVVPWCAALAWRLRPSIRWLWAGALAGLAGVAGVALWQVMTGIERVHGWSNPLVFAIVTMQLAVLAVYCRPPAWRWAAWCAAAGVVVAIVAMLLSGSRGVVPGVAVLLLSVLLLGRRDRLWLRIGVLALVVLAGGVALATIPALGERSRIDEAVNDAQQIQRGHMDTSIGARLELLGIAGRAIAAHPLTGVGMGQFGAEVRRQPACRMSPAPGWCELGHAHNDLAQWGATLGIPGMLLIALVYGVPLVMFVRMGWRRRKQGSVGPAWAGALVVSGFVLCGMTQSIMAHAATSGLFGMLVGTLLGLAWRDDEPRIGASA